MRLLWLVLAQVAAGGVWLTSSAEPYQESIDREHERQGTATYEPPAFARQAMAPTRPAIGDVHTDSLPEWFHSYMAAWLLISLVAVYLYQSDNYSFRPRDWPNENPSGNKVPSFPQLKLDHYYSTLQDSGAVPPETNNSADLSVYIMIWAGGGTADLHTCFFFVVTVVVQVYVPIVILDDIWRREDSQVCPQHGRSSQDAIVALTMMLFLMASIIIEGVRKSLAFTSLLQLKSYYISKGNGGAVASTKPFATCWWQPGGGNRAMYDLADITFGVGITAKLMCYFLAVTVTFCLFTQNTRPADVIVSAVAVNFLVSVDTSITSLASAFLSGRWDKQKYVAQDNLNRALIAWQGSPQNERWLAYFSTISFCRGFAIAPELAINFIVATVAALFGMVVLGLAALCG